MITKSIPHPVDPDKTIKIWRAGGLWWIRCEDLEKIKPFGEHTITCSDVHKNQLPVGAMKECFVTRKTDGRMETCTIDCALALYAVDPHIRDHSYAIHMPEGVALRQKVFEWLKDLNHRMYGG